MDCCPDGEGDYLMSGEELVLMYFSVTDKTGEVWTILANNKQHARRVLALMLSGMGKTDTEIREVIGGAVVEESVKGRRGTGDSC